MELLYGLVVIIATTIGAMTGLGGGVIIKPVFDFMGLHDISNISFLSSCAVLTMACVNVGRQVRSKQKFDLKMIAIVSIGSALGGYIGTVAFSSLLELLGSTTVLRSQAIALIILLLGVIFVMTQNVKHYTLKSPVIIFAVGMVLGFTSSYLGIGGGPVNVAVFNILFSMDFKKSAIYSVATIMFSQITTLTTIALTTGFGSYDTGVLIYILPCAVIGGFIGSSLSRRLSSDQLKLGFNAVMVALVILNVVNLINS